MSGIKHVDKSFIGCDPSLSERYTEIYGDKDKNHLKHDDFACLCCGISLVDKGFLRRINRLIDKLGEKVEISSGYRCPKYNAELGGSKNSAHVNGIAIDIKEDSARAKRKIVNVAIAMGFMGIGVYNKHIHLDDNKRWHGKEVIWSGSSK